MKIRLSTLALAACASFGVQAQDLTPNTKQINVSGFFQLNPSTGDYDRYQAIGFYEPQAGTAPARVSMMPQITVRSGGIAFIGKDGKTIKDDNAATEGVVAKIKVSLNYNGSLPTATQQIGVMAQVLGTGETVAVPVLKTADLKNPASLLVYLPEAVKAQAAKEFASVEDQRKKQAELITKWSQSSPQVVAINGVTISLIVDGEVVAVRTTPSNLLSSGPMPDLFIADPSEATINRIKEREFQVQVDYSFLDSKTGSINAEFDFEQHMRQQINESRVLQSKSKSTGVQILGFGRRKSSMSQFMKEQSTVSASQDNRAGTVIQMRDADDGLIAMFESKFFPQLSKADAAKAHEEAGKLAESQGNKALAAAHFGYAKAILEDKPNMDVDTAGALASLSAGDYAGFVAKGIKMQTVEGGATSQYSRVMSKEVDSKQEIQWTAVRTVSTQRKVSQILSVSHDKRKALLGMCSVNTMPRARPYPMMAPGYVPPPPLMVMFPSCLLAGGPLDRAGITPYDEILMVDGMQITGSTTIQDIDNVLNKNEPGTQIEVRKFINFHPSTGAVQYQTVKVRLGKSTVSIE